MGWVQLELPDYLIICTRNTKTNPKKAKDLQALHKVIHPRQVENNVNKFKRIRFIFYIRMNIFNKFLRNDPTYVNIKDKNNILHIIHVTTQSNYIKLKFGKYRLMDNKEHFYKAQRLFHILSRFIQKIKTHRYITRNSDIDCDLRMAPFEPKTEIDLLEQRCIYKFNIHDLLNIIATSLFQQSFMFMNPQFPKNPYTNLHFSVHNLYNIYLKCKCQHILVPEIFERFFRSGFDIRVFKETNKIFLLESCIDNYFSPNLDVYDDTVSYIYDMCYPFNIYIDKEFPRSRLYAIFRPYLKCYIRSRLFDGENDISYYLKCFDLYNPYFGRKYIDDNDPHTVLFDDRHLPFQEIKNGIFKTIKNTQIFQKCCDVKYNCDDFQCISLHPISHVTYLDIYIEDYKSEDEEEEEEEEEGVQDSEDTEEEDYDF